MNNYLSEQETAILKLICDGYTSGDIARFVFLSKRTVEDIRGRLIERFDCKNITHLVYVLSKKGLI